MSARNAFSLLNETDGSDTSCRTIRLTHAIGLLPGMDWTETLKQGYTMETDTIVEEEETVNTPAVVEEKQMMKKSKKTKKVQPKRVEEDIDSILKDMGIEFNEEETKEESVQKNEGGKKKINKKTVSKAAAIIANETAQRKGNKKAKK